MKILIAEDEFTTRMMVQVSLENWGYRVESVTNGNEAWAAFQKPDAPHIAILDWEMPELDGVEVCRRVKEMEALSHPYILLLTGRDSKTDIVRGFDAGADDYMTKPFNDNELRARVRVAERLVRTQASLVGIGCRTEGGLESAGDARKRHQGLSRVPKDFQSLRRRVAWFHRCPGKRCGSEISGNHLQRLQQQIEF